MATIEWHVPKRTQRRRDRPVETLRVTVHQRRILEIMAETGAAIFYDSEACVLLTTPQRKLSHRALKSLRATRLIRPMDGDVTRHVLTNRGYQVVAAGKEGRDG